MIRTESGAGGTSTRERKRLLPPTVSNSSSTNPPNEESDSEAGSAAVATGAFATKITSPPSGGNIYTNSSNSRQKDGFDFTVYKSLISSVTSIKFIVLIVLSLQNSLFTVLRRYSQGIKKEDYSKYEVLMMGEIIKLLFSTYIIHVNMIETYIAQHQSKESSDEDAGNSSSHKRSSSLMDANNVNKLFEQLRYLVRHSGKMFGLALIYGVMNILSFVSLRNIGAGLFTIIAQCKILTTATFSAVLLQRHYSHTKWRALISLVFGVLLFSESIWNNSTSMAVLNSNDNSQVAIGICAVLIEVTLSGFASIYFEKVIKLDPLQLSIWERNFQLALGSLPVYICFILWDGGGTAGLFGGWSFMAWIVTFLGAAGGLLVALSIKYGDAILKTLATTAAIILSSVLDNMFLGGPLTPIMVIAGIQVVIAICNYTFDATLENTSSTSGLLNKDKASTDIEIGNLTSNQYNNVSSGSQRNVVDTHQA